LIFAIEMKAFFRAFGSGRKRAPDGCAAAPYGAPPPLLQGVPMIIEAV
jgi:hypothetical protein